MPTFINYKKGISLYLTVILLAIVLAIVVGLGAILIVQIRIVRQIGYSVVALYSADTGVERKLLDFKDRGDAIIADPPLSEFLDIDGNGSVPSGDCPDNLSNNSNDSCYRVQVFGAGEEQCSGVILCIRSVGVYRGIRRAIEVRI